MLQPLLIEIGTQELPAIPFLKELPNIEKKWLDVLEKNALTSEFELYYTPRRIVIYHSEFATKQADSVEELYGAPVEIAYKDGEPTNAALSFAKKCGVELDQIGRASKGPKEVLYYKKEIVGQSSSELLGAMVDEFVRSLKFGKSMRWESRDDSFIRPIVSLSIVLGHDLVKADLFDISSSMSSFVHRNYAYDAIKFDSIKGYFELLTKNGVILYQDERKQKILDQFKALESEKNIEIEIDEELLAEIVAITEYPTALVGEFDQAFLEVPDEVIITSMKEHQRYFAVREGGKLVNKFVVVSNSVSEDYSKIISGNEKVLRARLSDALFFWHNDLKRGLDNSGLENILFVDGLGTLVEKLEREKKIASYLYNLYAEQVDFEKEELLKAIELSKADLMSEMVYEFTELQGVMGGYYAKAQGLSDSIATAITEQYLPKGEDSELPSTLFSSLVALSNKLDTLIGLFSIGMIPTGSRDPFALRRAVGGIIQIVLEQQIAFDIEAVFESLGANYKDQDIKVLNQFFIDRFDKFFSANASVIQAVVTASQKDIVMVNDKIIALDKITKSDDWRNSTATFKRVANITKDMNGEPESINESLLSESAEKELYSAYQAELANQSDSYEEQLDALMGLQSNLANFFDNVMVNADDEAVKTNRKNLIYNIYKSFYSIADISIVTT
jgi:glycyl-tRNA synthetase beta chain